MSSTLGSSTMTGWKRRSSAASFSMCLRYSSSVVAPMQCSSPRASIGFSMLPASIAPSAAPGADDGVQLVDEQQDPALGRLDLLQHRLQALLELAAVLRARDERAHVEGEDRLVAQPLGHVAAHDALREALDDRRLADARLADQHRVVLGLAREDLDHAPDLGVAPDHRVEPPAARLGDEVAPVLLERLVGRLGRGARDALAAAHLGQRLEEALARHAVLAEQPPGGGLLRGRRASRAGGARPRRTRPSAARLLLGRVEQLCELPRHARLAAAARPAHAGPPLELRLQLRMQRLGVDALAHEQPLDQALGLVEQGEQQVLGRRPRCGRSGAPWSARRAGPPGTSGSGGSDPWRHLAWSLGDS